MSRHSMRFPKHSYPLNRRFFGRLRYKIFQKTHSHLWMSPSPRHNLKTKLSDRPYSRVAQECSPRTTKARVDISLRAHLEMLKENSQAADAPNQKTVLDFYFRRPYKSLFAWLYDAAKYEKIQIYEMKFSYFRTYSYFVA